MINRNLQRMLLPARSSWARLAWPALACSGLLWPGLLANFKSRQGRELTLAGSGSGLATNKLLSAVKATDRAVLTPQPHVTTLPPAPFTSLPSLGYDLFSTLRFVHANLFCVFLFILSLFSHKSPATCNPPLQPLPPFGY